MEYLDQTPVLFGLNVCFYVSRITSPLLLIAVAASLGACFVLSLRNAEKKIILGGHEVPLAHQYAAVGLLSLPVFYIAGAGAALFWVLGKHNICTLSLSLSLSLSLLLLFSALYFVMSIFLGIPWSKTL